MLQLNSFDIIEFVYINIVLINDVIDLLVNSSGIGKLLCYFSK